MKILVIDIGGTHVKLCEGGFRLWHSDAQRKALAAATGR
jgi:hexokinase